MSRTEWIHCAALSQLLAAGAPQGAQGPWVLAGRVLAWGEATFQLADDSGALKIRRGSLEDQATAGDIVRLEVAPAGEPRHGPVDVVARRLEVLTAYRALQPFPDPAGDYYRLNSSDPPRRVLLRQRARALAAIRAFFDARNYIEVQPPLRVVAPGLEPHLVAIPSGDHYLTTSPEFQMKRLLAGGMERIYALAPCFRGEELGGLHLPEFTMLEWYCAYGTLAGLMDETQALIEAVTRSLLGAPQLFYDGWSVDLKEPFVRLSVADAFLRYGRVRLAGVVDAELLRQRAEAAGFGPFVEGTSYEEVFSRVLVEEVEPALRALGGVFLHRFPAPLAALARLCPDDPTVAQRFELYLCGVELANAFSELTDPVEQLSRLRADQNARRLLRRDVYPIDKKFVAALREGIPPTVGIALGVDRLVAMICGQKRIADVAAFAPDEL